MQNECSVNACCAAAPLHLMYFWLWPCPSCVQVLGRQVKGAWWQNAWCVAYFPGFDLPWMQRCEENEDELEHGGCPTAGEREDELMDIKCLLCFLFLFCPFHLSVYLSFTVMACLRSAQGSRGDFGQTADCCSGHGKTQPSASKQNTGQWITASKGAHDFILTSRAPDMMVFVLLGHQGLENCSPSLHMHTYRKTHTYTQLVLHFTLSSHRPWPLKANSYELQK